jgi:hypothetical protein
MSPRQDPDLTVQEEPEGRRPIGTGEEPDSESNGLALDPYADDVLIGPRRRRAWPWPWIGIAVLALIAAVILALVILRAG